MAAHVLFWTAVAFAVGLQLVGDRLADWKRAHVLPVFLLAASVVYRYISL